jgi:hypothetical protein
LKDWVQVSFPNLAGFVLIPLALLVVCLRVVWVEANQFGVDIWTVLSIAAVVALVAMAVLGAIFEFLEAVDDYDMPEFEPIEAE